MKPFRANGRGAYRCYDPRVKKVVSLGTEDFAEATRLADELAQYKYGRKPLDAGGGRIEPTTAAPTSDLPGVGGRVDPSELLGAWVADGGTGVAGPTLTAPQDGTPAADSSPGVGEQRALSLPSAEPRPRKKGGLTPEQAAKIGTGMKKIACKLNVVAIGACVQMLGRDPYPVDDDELELLATGWEMWLEELFVKTQPKPWMLVAAGNLLIAFAMYVNGTEIAKPQPQGSPADIEHTQ